MFAIVEIAGQQFKIQADQTLFVHRLAAEEGDSITIDKVLLTAADGGSPTLGTPFTGGSISAKVLGHVKGDKVIVFHKKRRKGYRKRNGHRQQFTKIQIGAIA